jgi:hypothetical protein
MEAVGISEMLVTIYQPARLTPQKAVIFISTVLKKPKGKPEGKRPLGRPRRRWVDNIKIDLREIG